MSTLSIASTPAVLRPRGVLGAVEARAIATALTNRIRSNTPVVLELAEVVDMDLAALSALVVARRSANLAGVPMMVTGPVAPAVADLLEDALLGPFLGLDASATGTHPS